MNPLMVMVGAGKGEAAPPPEGPALVFASDWGTATGTSDNAIEDGGKWDRYLNSMESPPADAFTVVSTSGLGFPAGMDNCLAIRIPDNPTGAAEGNEDWRNWYFNVMADDAWPGINVGESIYFRVYWRFQVDNGPPGADRDNLHSPQPASEAYAKQHNINKVGTTQLTFAIANKNNDSTNIHIWDSGLTLSRTETYRTEEQYIKKSASTYEVHARLYDSSDTLIADDDDFDDGLGNTMASYATGGGTITSQTANSMRGIRFGFPGQECGCDTGANKYEYIGGFAVSHEDWCGPYVAGEAD